MQPPNDGLPIHALLLLAWPILDAQSPLIWFVSLALVVIRIVLLEPLPCAFHFFMLHTGVLSVIRLQGVLSILLWYPSSCLHSSSVMSIDTAHNIWQIYHCPWCANHIPVEYIKAWMDWATLVERAISNAKYRPPGTFYIVAAFCPALMAYVTVCKKDHMPNTSSSPRRYAAHSQGWCSSRATWEPVHKCSAKWLTLTLRYQS